MSYARICCSMCSSDFGQESKFFDHITKIHNISDHESHYVDIVLAGIKPTCACMHDCASPLKWYGWKKGYPSKYSRGHNARVDSVYLQPERQREFANKRAKGYSSGKYTTWNTGLTAESDERVARQSLAISNSLRKGYESGSIIDWRTSDPEKAANAAEKMSATKRGMYSSGAIIPWNKGRTKFDDKRLAASSASIKKNYVLHPESSAKRLTLDEAKRRIEETQKFKLADDSISYKNKYQKFELICLKCGDHQFKNIMMAENSPICFACAPKESKGQLEVFDFVKSLVPDATLSDRTLIAPKELDVYVPTRKFAIEYNGLYWHSSAVISDHKYHDAKSKACEAAGISLFSIYEDEWQESRKIIESMIRHRLGLPLFVTDARKLDLVMLTKKESTLFFDENHLEGSTPSTVTFGLKDKTSGTVLAAMSLRRPFHRKYIDKLEVGRCCTAAGHSVRGWLGKLTTAAVKYAVDANKSGLMTYVDSRVGSGTGYRLAGWTQSGTTSAPRFWWTDFKNRFNRFKYRADASKGLTQSDVAKAAGVSMIWGCGNRLYTIEMK